MALVRDTRLAGTRVAAGAIGIAVVWLTVLAFSRGIPVDLTIALLVVLAEVVAVAVFSGPVLAVVAALAAVILVNWYLVPPYGTFEIASTENVVALVVFVFVAGVAAALVEFGARARARAEVSARQAELLGEVVATVEGDDARTALERVRSGLELDQVDLRHRPTGGAEVVLASAGPDSRAGVVIDVSLPDGYRLVGRGAERFAPDPEFLVSLGTAVVRAHESEQLQVESQRAEELEAIDRARTALLASVGHDLRTPLASLRLSIETLRAPDAHLSPQDRELLMTTIESSTERLDDLITNLLDMSRLQAGAVLAHAEATDLGEVVARTLLAFPTDRIRVALSPDVPAVSADPALLERVIANLLSNSLRYSPPDRVVEVASETDASQVTLLVRDHGPGIGRNEVEEVFTPFHRVGAQPDGGTGLGLAIVKGFTEAMGMGIRLDSEPGVGLTAHLTMTRWDARGAAA